MFPHKVFVEHEEHERDGIGTLVSQEVSYDKEKGPLTVNFSFTIRDSPGNDDPTVTKICQTPVSILCFTEV